MHEHADPERHRVDATTVPQARARMLAAVEPLGTIETLPLGEALGRVCAEALLAPFPVPPFDNAAMDGYALRWSDLEASGGRLPIAGRVAAGDARTALPPGTALRIFTGAAIPDGADTVVRQELARASGGMLQVDEGAKDRIGANVRPAGGDLAPDATVVPAGRRLQPVDLGLMASVGAASVRVRRRARVVVLVSGDELTPPGQPLEPGRIFESNGVMLAAVLRSLDAEVLAVRRVADSAAATHEALARAAGEADLVVSSGGVSVGDEDHLKAAVRGLGAVTIDGLPIQPGKPLGFGHVHGTPWFGLPGNPVASLLTCLLFVAPVVRRLHGRTDTLPMPYRLPAAFERPRAMQREAHLRVRRDGDTLALAAKQGSGVLSSAAASDGLAVVPIGATVAPGDLVAFHPFADLLA